jgi:DNA-binding CsgD family transcriptional regulator
VTFGALWVSDERPILGDTMPGLEAIDLARLGRFVAETAEVPVGDEPFPRAFLAALRRLVPCDFVCYTESDRSRCRQLGFVEDPVYDGPEPEFGRRDLAPDDPLGRFLRYANESLDFRAYRLSDFVSTRELRRSEMFAKWYGTTGVVHQLLVGLDAPQWHTKEFRFDRCGGPDFTDNDRAVLDALRPVLAARRTLWLAARQALPIGPAEVGLTARERDVLELLSEGLTNAEIARQLWIAPGTVRRHLEHIYDKLGVHTRTAAARATSRTLG